MSTLKMSKFQNVENVDMLKMSTFEKVEKMTT